MTLETALEAPRPLCFYAAKFVFPAATVRLLSGEATIEIDGETYTGGDETYGVMADLEPLEDGGGVEAPSVRIVLQPPSPSVWTTLRDPAVQGSAVTLFEGVLDPTTGVVVAAPEPIFIGEFDTVQATFERGALSLLLDVVTVFDRFFEEEEGARLCDPWHQTYWPGEKGLDQVTGISKRLPWGVGGGGTGFRGRRASEHDWSRGSPLTQKIDRAMGGLSHISDPTRRWRWTGGQLFGND